MLIPPRKTVRKARTLRRKMTLPEVLLWRELRRRPLNLKFRRQHPFGPYVIDFFCAEVNLAIEVDGHSHDQGNRPLRDKRRNDWLAAQNVHLLRIPANDVLRSLENDVLRSLENTVEQIVKAAIDAKPLHQPEAGPPPRSGEDLA